MNAHEFAIVDTETTGIFRNSDRIIEIAIVRISNSGDLLSEYTTLVNPLRDVGPITIHGITASQLLYAPTFDEIAGDVLHQISGAIFVGHNVLFDLEMVRSEFARIGFELPMLPALCTMRLARHYGIRAKKLHDCCSRFGIPLRNEHCALDDARATTDLLRLYIDIDPRKVSEEIPKSIPSFEGRFELTGKVSPREKDCKREPELPRRSGR